MDNLVWMLVGLGFAVLAAHRLVSGLVRLHRADRARQVRLRALERNPREDSARPADIARGLDTAVGRAAREDLSLTGAMLAAISVAGVFIGRAIGYGEWAVGLYTAGLVGIVAGVALALLGGVVRVLALPLLRNDDDGASF